jgi:hypothetical protein
MEHPLSTAGRDEILRNYHKIWGTQPRAGRNPAPQPVSLERKDLPQLLEGNYMVADKSDGVRTLLFLTEAEGQPVAVLVDRRLNLQPIPIAASRRFFSGTLFDGELVWINSAAGPAQALLIFDVVALRGTYVGKLPFTERGALVRTTFDLEDADIPTVEKAHALARRGKILAGSMRTGLVIWPKTCFHLSMLDTLLRTLPTLPYATDGLVFTPIDEPVRTGTHRTLFKLKQHHTVDVQCWPSLRRVALGLGGGPSTAVQRVDLAEAAPELQLSGTFWSALDTLGEGAVDGIIVECRLSGAAAKQAPQLVPEMLRTDKEHPNTVETVQRTTRNFREAISVEEVLHFLSNGGLRTVGRCEP